MELTILELIQNYGLDSVLIAAAVCILTGLIKMPIKSLAARTKEPSKYTKYITFLPLFLGLGITVLYEYIVTKSVVFTGKLITLWLTSSSISLAIYAFIEKFIPSKKKILSAEEIKQNEEMLELFKNILTAEKSSEKAEKSTAVESEDETLAENFTTETAEVSNMQTDESEQGKIILRGKKNA